MVAKGLARKSKAATKNKAGIQETKPRTVNSNTFDQFLDKECNDIRYKTTKMQSKNQFRGSSTRTYGQKSLKKSSPSHRFLENKWLKQENKSLK